MLLGYSTSNIEHSQGGFMKLSLFKGVLLATMIVAAVGCGKDSKPSNSNGYYSNLTGTITSGAQAQTNLQSYLSSVETNQNIYGPVQVSKVRYSCQSKDLFGINFLPYQSCSSSNLPVQTVMVAQGQIRSQINPALATVLTPPAGYTLLNINQSGNIVVIQHAMGTEVYEVTIDMNRHSAVNPVQIKDSANKKIEYVLSTYPSGL
jgi:hypothetical protein